MVRICTGDVCVRSSRSSAVRASPSPRISALSIQNVSVRSFVGWWSGVLSAVKLLKRVSMSGPSATVKPSFPKIRAVSAMTRLSGCSTPGAGQRPGSVASTSSALALPAEAPAPFAASAASTSARQACTALPKAGRSSFGTSFIALMSAGMEPFRPTYLIRSCSTAAASAAAAISASDAAFPCSSSSSVIRVFFRKFSILYTLTFLMASAAAPHFAPMARTM